MSIHLAETNQLVLEMKLNLLVIRTLNPERLKQQYEKLGFVFNYHQHGNAPFHFASEQDDFVFEIYPLTKSMDKADNSLRLGFEVDDLQSILNAVEKSDWRIIQDAKESEWGITAIIQDLDGRKIDLKSK